MRLLMARRVLTLLLLWHASCSFWWSLLHCAVSFFFFKERPVVGNCVVESIGDGASRQFACLCSAARARLVSRSPGRRSEFSVPVHVEVADAACLQTTATVVARRLV